MKLKFIYKGGPGSGFHGHVGRPGEVGGSQANNQLFPPGSKVKSEDALLALLKAAKSDERIWKLIIGTELDGGNPITENLDWTMKLEGGDFVLEETDPEMAFGEHVVRSRKTYNEIQDILQEMFVDAENARSEGWFDPKDSDDINADRRAFEEKYYGKVIGGHSKSYVYGVNELKKFFEQKLGNDITYDIPKEKKIKDPIQNFYQRVAPLGKTVTYAGYTGNIVSHGGVNIPEKYKIINKYELRFHTAIMRLPSNKEVALFYENNKVVYEKPDGVRWYNHIIPEKWIEDNLL